MQQRDLEYARLSGIQVPVALTEALDEAKAKLSTIRAKKEELAGRKVASQNKIRELVHLEAAALVENGGDGKLARRRELAEGHLASASALLGEMQNFVAGAENKLQEAEQALQTFINDRLAEGRAAMKAMLDIVQNERARQLGSLKNGEVLRTARPNKSARSRIACCESCTEPIAIIREGARQPLTAESFEKLPKYDFLPFKPGQGIEYFLCPVCRKTPWLEPDRVLTNMGYKMIPVSEQQDHEEPTIKEGEDKNA